jgi:hypothetical protein
MQQRRMSSIIRVWIRVIAQVDLRILWFQRWTGTSASSDFVVTSYFPVTTGGSSCGSGVAPEFESVVGATEVALNSCEGDFWLEGVSLGGAEEAVSIFSKHDFILYYISIESWCRFSSQN